MSGWLQRNRSLLVIALGTLAALAVAVALTGGPRTGADHDPENPGARGARALAQVLEDEGVEVDIVRSADALEEASLGEDTTVLVTSPENLGRTTAARLLGTASQSSVVVVGAGPGVVEALGVDARRPLHHADGPQQGDCTDTGLGDVSGLEIEVDAAGSYATTAGCFPSDSGWALASGGQGLVLLGADGIVENDQVLRADNAAVALRLFGQQRAHRLVRPEPRRPRRRRRRLAALAAPDMAGAGAVAGRADDAGGHLVARAPARAAGDRAVAGHRALAGDHRGPRSPLSLGLGPRPRRRRAAALDARRAGRPPPAARRPTPRCWSATWPPASIDPPTTSTP